MKANKIIMTLFILLLAVSFLSGGCTMRPKVEIESNEDNTFVENVDEIELSEPIKPEEKVEIEDVENIVENVENTEELEEPIEEPEEPELIMYFTEKDVVTLAKVIFREAGGIPSDMEKACVGWVACNRVDAGYGETIYEVLTAPYQFAWIEDTPIREDLYALALDVLTRWNNEKNGIDNVGRVLPSNYMWFYGDGYHNHFRDSYSGNFSIWNYSLENPYED